MIRLAGFFLATTNGGEGGVNTSSQLTDSQCIIQAIKYSYHQDHARKAAQEVGNLALRALRIQASGVCTFFLEAADFLLDLDRTTNCSDSGARAQTLQCTVAPACGILTKDPLASGCVGVCLKAVRSARSWSSETEMTWEIDGFRRVTYQGSVRKPLLQKSPTSCTNIHQTH